MGTTALSRRPGSELTAGSPNAEKRRRFQAMAAQLKQDRQPFEAIWKDLASFFRPMRTRFQSAAKPTADRRNERIIDSTGVFASRTLAAGMMSGITSPARQWFKFTLADTDLLEQETVKWWLEEVRSVIAAVLTRSNFYGALPTYYGDLGVFATAAMIVEEDDETVIRCTPFAVGEYYIGYNARAQVRVFMREFDLTVRQIVEQFGVFAGDSLSTKNLSLPVQSAWRENRLETRIKVCHYITENPDHRPLRLEAKHKRFASVYYEVGAPDDLILHETGYDEWPIMVTRWDVASGDVYGTDCPGMIALGDNKTLQYAKKLGEKAIAKAVDPPIVVPVSMKNSAISLLPGGVNYTDETSDRRVRPVMEGTNQLRLDWLLQLTTEVQEAIRRAFFEDLFLLISQIDRADVTATEILEKKEEKLLALGPVLEQVNDGFLDPLFDRVYGILERRGLLPPPPPELEGQDFHPEYESIMAQAQRAQGRSGVEAFAIFSGNVAKMDPTVLDRVNVDEMIETGAEVYGVPPKFLRSDEQVDATRKARADAAKQQQAAQAAEAMAGTAKNLASADTSSKNALTDLLGSAAPSDVLGAGSPVGGL